MTNIAPTLLAARSALPPEGAQSALGRPGGGFTICRTRIKICGITREEDLDAAVAAGADAIGFVLYPKSPRYVSPKRATELARRLPPFVTPVLLFVNATVAEVQTASRLIPGATLQFHGDESPADCDAAALAANSPYLRAARIPLGEGAAQFDLVKYAHNFSNARAILLDAHVDGYGGGGKVFNWSLLPPSVNAQLVLSGGLDASNVGDGIAQVRPRCFSLAVDISSGVEATDADGLPMRGIKDQKKINQFVAAVHAADQRLAGIM
jgi:phosphoribosylanthranilate isomerase